MNSEPYLGVEGAQWLGDKDDTRHTKWINSAVKQVWQRCMLVLLIGYLQNCSYSYMQSKG